MSRRVQVLLAIVGCAGALAIAGGTSAAASRAHATPAPVTRVEAVAHPATAVAVVKFLAHAGAAYYVFDHFIWKPYKAGDLHGFTHVLTIAKAALAALFVYEQVKAMAGDVKGSKLLSFLAAPIALAIAKLSALKSEVTGGKLSVIATIESYLGSISQKAGSRGIVIKEIQHAV